jgi:hypothetical protein
VSIERRAEESDAKDMASDYKLLHGTPLDMLRPESSTSNQSKSPATSSHYSKFAML